MSDSEDVLPQTPMTLQEVLALFPELSDQQVEQLTGLCRLFREWNGKLNLVSRQDILHFEEHHLLHALAAAKCVRFPARARVMDIGTGGGLPGLPLAILFPQTRFFLVDSVAKKMAAVADMITQLGIKNAEAVNKRAEQLESKFDYVIGRAVAPLPQILSWVGHTLRTFPSYGKAALTDPAPGILYFKGTLYAEELEVIRLKPYAVHDLHTVTNRPYFNEKYLVHLEASAAIKAIPRREKENGSNRGRNRR